MTKASCYTCVYAYLDMCQVMQSFTAGFPCRPACANHPDSLGRMRPVPAGGVCRNYRPKPAEPDKAAKRIPLSDGVYAYVDAGDYKWLSQWTWHVEDGYAVRWEKGKRVYMHRQIMEPPDGMVVDHANRNRADNCRSNLRVCTRDENMRNKVKRAGSASQFKGVGFARGMASGLQKSPTTATGLGLAFSTPRSRRPGPTTMRRSSTSAHSPTPTSPKNGRPKGDGRCTPSGRRPGWKKARRTEGRKLRGTREASRQRPTRKR